MRIAILLCTALLLGCSDDLSHGKAADLMQERFTYFEDPRLDVFVGKVGKCDAHLPAEDPSYNAAYQVLQKLGYVDIRPAGRGYWWVSFTDAGNSAVKNEGSWSRSGKPLKDNGCERYLAALTLAKMKREAPTITGILREGNLAKADYKCSYELTALGQKLSVHEGFVDTLPIDQKLELDHAIMARAPIHLPLSEDDCGGSYIFQKYEEGWRIK